MLLFLLLYLGRCFTVDCQVVVYLRVWWVLIFFPLLDLPLMFNFDLYPLDIVSIYYIFGKIFVEGASKKQYAFYMSSIRSVCA